MNLLPAYGTNIAASGALSPIAGLTYQAFTFSITNESGTLRHRISRRTDFGGSGTAATAELINRFNGFTNSLTNTPTGTDASTAFAGGGKISSANNNAFVFDQIAAEVGTQMAVTANLSFCNTGDNILSVPGVTNTNVNGVAKLRFTLFFYTRQTGLIYTLNTTNIASGETIAVQILGWLN
jgi:hypothetical protein